VGRELRARLKHAFDNAGVRLTEPVVVPASGGSDTSPAAPAPEPTPPVPPAGPAAP
ncbi:MAG: mechanosensitive ion channel family protein, partial [Streptomycetaceae bacterium]|nr:mechanosensitive ion channel family protein [Streptomycetaceae bacterium]